MRILITGSRDWDNIGQIRHTLSLFARPTDNKIVTLVSGNCPTGADFICEEIARSAGWLVELHPANWGMHNKKAGFIRNKAMVDAGADVCLAFIKNNSKGATMCADLAEKAGIRTVRITSEKAGEA